MATCHDCLHHAACAAFADGKDWEQSWITYGQNGQCEDFKDKYLFVEVVRCKNCKWRNTSGCPYMNFKAAARDDDDYCSDGERKEHAE